MYGNFPDPTMAMYQNRLRSMQAQYQPIQPPQMYGNMPMQSGLKGRVVTGRDEAKAAQIDLDGTPHYFDSPSETTIYKKSIGLDGMPIFEEYKRVIPQAQPKESDIIAALQSRIEMLERKLEGVYMNVQSNAIHANDAVGQSDADVSTAVRQ